MRNPTFFLTLAVLLTALSFSHAQEPVPIPADVAQELGVTPDVVERFVLLYEEGVVGEGRRSRGSAFQNAPVIETAQLANVAADRWLFKITFSEDYRQEGNTFILYLDVDNDLTTGRQENDTVRGVDLMYTQRNGQFSLAEHTPGLRSDPLRMAVVGNAMYVCADLPLGEGQAEGKVRYRALSHVSSPVQGDTVSLRWQVADLPERAEGRKPRIGAPPPLAPVAELATHRPDADGDGIPDEVELQLGMDHERPDALHFVHDDLPVAEGDTTVSGQFERANDITRVFFGNVAGDRWVWRIDFADQFRAADNRIILYVDADNDLETGRQDGPRGTDVMLICEGGGFSAAIHNPDVTAADRRVRGAIDGNSLYFSMDLTIYHNEDGHSEHRAMVLSQGIANPSDSDRTEWFRVIGPPMQDLPKPRPVPVSQVRSEGVYVTPPWLGWREDIRRAGALALDPAAAELEGMSVNDLALVPEAEDARATFRVPQAGDFHVGVMLRDSAEGEQALEMLARGERVARLAAAQSDGALYLFITREPVRFNAGDPLEIRVAAPAQDFYVAEVLLSPEMLLPGDLRLTHLGAYCPPGQTDDSVSVDITWLTNEPFRGRVLWGEGGALDNVAEERVATYNHLVRLEHLRLGAQYSAQVVGTGAHGEVRSEVIRFTASFARPAQGNVTRRSVQLAVADSLEGVARPAWPLSGGVPLPEGALADARQCRLLNAQGNPVAAQFTALGHWPGGTIKWLLVSTLHEGGDGGYTLEYGRQVSAPPPPEGAVEVERTPEGLRVSTGVLRADISREGFAPPGVVRMDLDGDGAISEDEVVAIPGEEGVVLVDAEGRRFTTAGAELSRLTVEEEGPVRAVILAEGRFTSEAGELLGFRCRMYFHHGFAGIPTVFTVLVDEGTSIFPPTMTPITSLTMPVSLAAEVDAPAVRWLQDYDNRVVITEDGEERAEDRQGPGMASLGEGARQLSVGIKDFWQTYPKAFSVEGATITAELLPELPPDAYAQHTDPKLLTQHYYWQREGTYLLPMGTAPSHDVLFYFGAVEDTEAETHPLEAAFQQPALLAATPEHYTASGAFMDLLPEREGAFEEYRQYVRQGFDALEATRRRVREYSWMDYGDWYGERVVNWGNLEYDLAWGLLVQFARAGDVRFFDRAEQAARHMVGIDSVNAVSANQPHLLGIQKYHSVGHTGGHNLTRPEGLDYWFTNAGYNTGHIWTQGPYMAYALTGDRRFLDTVELTAHWFALQYAQSLETWVHRNYGWAMIGVLGAYQVTPHPVYLNAARLFADYVITRQCPGTGVWAHPIGECTHSPRHMGGKVFMSGVVMTGLKMLDQIEPRDDIKHAVVRTCDWIYHRMWHPWDNSFQYAQCPQYDQSSTHAGTYEANEGMAYAVQIAGKPEHREMLERSLADMMARRASGHGKGYAMQIRMTPFTLSMMEGWGMTELPLPPPPEPQVGADRRLYLHPDRPATLGLTVNNRGLRPLEATAELVELPAGLTADRTTAQWRAQPGVARAALFSLRGEAATGQVVRLRWRIGEYEGEAEVSVQAAGEVALGEAVGYVGAPGDPTGQALQALGLDLPTLPDLRPETVAGFRALVVGAEAHEKDFASLGREPERLLDFISSGGRAVIIQLQDTAYRGNHLPHELAVSNDSGALGEIIVRDHPIFSRPHHIETLAGVISYDTITAADPAWRVLAVDDKGQPAILETGFGKGTLLLVQPSPDRYIIGQVTPAGTLTAEACGQLLENVLAYVAGDAS